MWHACVRVLVALAFRRKFFQCPVRNQIGGSLCVGFRCITGHNITNHLESLGTCKKVREIPDLLRVERRRVELPASSLRTNKRSNETQAKQGNSSTRQESAHDCAQDPSNTPSLLVRLLAELAALPPEQRAALAKLIAASSVPAQPASLDDRLPWESEQGEGAAGATS
jgi:hypothetical protein